MLRRRVVFVLVVLRIVLHNHCTVPIAVVLATPAAPPSVAAVAVARQQQQYGGASVVSKTEFGGEAQHSNEDSTKNSTTTTGLSELYESGSLEKQPAAVTSLLPSTLTLTLQQIQQQQQQQHDSRTKESWFVSLLAASAGWGDVRAHRQYGCFVNMCTGNTIRGTLALVERQQPQKAILPWTIVAGYCGGVALARNVQNNMLTTNENQKRNQPQQQQQQQQQPQSKQQSKESSRFKNSHTCLAIVPVTVVLFALTDVLLYFYRHSYQNIGGSSSTSSTTTAKFWHTLSALPQAMAYGLMHETASQATGGTVLFAVTGHWASLARLSTDQTCTRPSENTTAIAKKLQKRRLLTRHSRIVASFVCGIVAAVLWLDYLVPLLPQKLAEMTHSVSYTITGIAYASLFYWFGNGNGGDCTY